MPPSSSSNRYSVLSVPEVRIEMEELPQIQQSTLSPQPNSVHAEECNASSASLPPPVRLETKPPPRRGMNWPLFAVKKSLEARSKLHKDWQKTRAAMEPEPPATGRPSLVENEPALPPQDEVDGEQSVVIEAEAEAETRANADAATTERTPKKPKIWDKHHPYVYYHLLNERLEDDSWKTLKRGIDRYDDEMCKAWNGELDAILTFTGLFSAAVTAFCIESFQALSQSSADTTNTFLLVISQQLANSSAPMASMSMVEGFIANTYDIQINVLYFVSLALALSVSSVCILGKQWIREYQKDLSVSSRDAIRVRQARFDSLEAWKVPQIMAALPVVLLMALMLFFSGLLIQLWNISDHTTAAMVSIVVSLTVTLVIITTIVPAYVSMKPRLSSFAPFRSPQAWIFFVVYRQIQHWYHRSSKLKRQHPILSSWSAFDLHFVKSETEYWFNDSISAVHCALRWMLDVLQNSSELEKCLVSCLRSEHYPQNLIKSEDALRYYVQLGSDEADGSNNIDRAYYDYSKRNEGKHKIDSAVGQRQAELLIRSAHRTLDDVSSNPQKSWDAILFACDRLWYHCIFDKYSGHDIVHHQHILQDQVALLYERIFTSSLPPPSHSFDWRYVISRLLNARRDSSSLLSRQVLHDVISQHIPTWIRIHKSISLLYNIGNKVRSLALYYPEHAIELFTHLDKIMVEFCSEPEGVEMLYEESIERWRDLRTRLIEKLRDPFWEVPVGFHLSDGYFDNLPGHGPLPSLPVPQPSLPSVHTDIETDIRQPTEMGSASDADNDQ